MNSADCGCRNPALMDSSEFAVVKNADGAIRIKWRFVCQHDTKRIFSIWMLPETAQLLSNELLFAIGNAPPAIPCTASPSMPTKANTAS